MDKIIIYHGSSEIVKQPVYGKGKPYNDYGIGFYCTEHLELAKEWACTKNIDGFVNEYELDLTHLKVLHLSEYSILHWLALLMVNRRFRISTPVMRRGFQWLKDNFLIDITGYDVIIGYRADDSYFSFARAFINNEISLTQLSYAMKLSEKSGVTLRMIQQYENRSKDINRAAAETLSALSRVLGCNVEDLLEYSFEEVTIDEVGD